jgi:sigma-E factor negative regulatory protein RseA
MKEKLSALIDGELEGDGLHAHLGRLRTDPELRSAWDTYHLIGDALRGQISPAIADRVVARLREEPTVLAPRPQKGPSRRLGWYAMAVAASVAAVGFVVWTASPGWRVEPQLAGGPAATTVATSVQAPATLVSSVPPAEVENYLLAHQPYSHTSAMQGIAPYARSVADERGAARK